MATPEEMIPKEAEDNEEVKGNVPELHVVKDTRGVEQTDGEPLSGEIKEYNFQGPTQEGETRRAEEAQAERKARYEADDKFGETVEKSDREDARERGFLRKFLGLKPKK